MRNFPIFLALKTSLRIFNTCSAFIAVVILASTAEARLPAAAPGGGQQAQNAGNFISVRLDVEQIQLVSEVGLVGSVEIGLKGA